MAKRATAVIGSLWGDEGKGSIVHDVTSSMGQDTIVCRYSGGANAGHTVMSDDGRRHVFSHIGSGSFAGAKTFLSRFFISNPVLWQKEMLELHDRNIHPEVYADFSSIVTTPIDVAINQALEIQRADNRHGSCGVGINETVTRNNHSNKDFHGDISILKDRGRLVEWLSFLHEEYLPLRMEEVGLKSLPSYIKTSLESGFAFDRYEFASTNFSREVEYCDASVLSGTENVVFEGSQGLLLDEEFGEFPHVTRARTGSHNVSLLCDDAGISEVETIYVVRAYATRHGDGPFGVEPGLSYKDDTNSHNDWQGTMRFGRLDVDKLHSAIESDISPLQSSRSVAITCADQIGEEGVVIIDGTKTPLKQNELHDVICRGLDHRSTSFGPSRSSIVLGYR